MKPQNFEERLIWYSIIGTYGLYFLGILLPANAVIGWVLFFCLCKKIWNQIEDTPIEQRIRIPWIIWVWIIAMPVILIARIIGLDDFGSDTNGIIRGIMSWFITWALLALFPLAGCLNIRPQLIYRAICIVCLQSLILIPICYLAYLIHLPANLFTSPVERIIQNGKLYYNVMLYIYTEYNHELRLSLFAPWGPALGIVGSYYFFLVLQEPNKKWRWIGVVGAIAMCIVSSSRLAFISVPIVILGVWVWTNFWRPKIQILAGFLSFLSGIFSTVLLSVARNVLDTVSGSRSESTRVRKMLVEFAFDRSQEAPIWGHGNQEPGPKVIEHMPIGSHTTWGGLMFMHGVVGLVSFLVPTICTFIGLLIKAQKSNIGKVGLSVFLVLILFSVGESLDALAYLCWPALLIIGIALKKEIKSPVPMSNNCNEESTLTLNLQ